MGNFRAEQHTKLKVDFMHMFFVDMSRGWQPVKKTLQTFIVTSHKNYSTNTTSTVASSQYCLDLVRQWDYEGFISTLLIPDAAQRTTAVALRAFNVEVALVAQRVSNPVIGQGRLHFWRDALDKISKGKPPSHPVALEIFRACQRHKLKHIYLQRLVSSRDSQLTSPGFESLADLEKYAENSMSPVFYLLVQAAGSADMKVDHAVSHLGKSLGISNAIRSLARARSPGELGIPRDLQLKHGVSQESLLRGAALAPGLRDAVFDVAACAKQHLDKARSLSSDVPRPLRSLLLPSMPVANYLERLRLTDFDPFDKRLQKRSVMLPLSMWWSRFRGSY